MSLHIVPEAIEVPGRCAVSKSTTGPFLDTQVTIPRHGRLYISIPWLESVSAELGWVPAADLHAATEDLDTALGVVAGLAERVEGFDEAVSNTTEAMVLFLAETRARGALVVELKAAREAISVLDEQVTALESGTA